MPSDIKEISIEVPEGDPTPFQLGDQHAIVGKPMPRLDAVAKVTGRAKYTHDMNLPGMLYAKLVTSPYAHATVKSVDVGEALKLEGVKVAKASGPKEVRYAGGRVAVVAATTRQIADEAARLVKVDYEPLPHAARHEQATADGAPQVLPNRPNRAADPANATSPAAQAAEGRRGPQGRGPRREGRREDAGADALAASRRTASWRTGKRRTASRCGLRPRRRSGCATSSPRRSRSPRRTSP